MAVVVLRAHVALFLAPVDLEETAAADLTQSLKRGLVHTCWEPDVIVSSLLRAVTPPQPPGLQILRLTWPAQRAVFGSSLQSFRPAGTRLALSTAGRAAGGGRTRVTQPRGAAATRLANATAVSRLRGTYLQNVPSEHGAHEVEL